MVLHRLLILPMKRLVLLHRHCQDLGLELSHIVKNLKKLPADLWRMGEQVARAALAHPWRSSLPFFGRLLSFIFGGQACLFSVASFSSRILRASCNFTWTTFGRICGCTFGADVKNTGVVPSSKVPGS